MIEPSVTKGGAEALTADVGALRRTSSSAGSTAEAASMTIIQGQGSVQVQLHHQQLLVDLIVLQHVLQPSLEWYSLFCLMHSPSTEGPRKR